MDIDQRGTNPFMVCFNMMFLTSCCNYLQSLIQNSATFFLWHILGAYILHQQILSLSLMLWSAVSRPVCLGIKHPYRAYNQIFITVSCGFLDMEHSLWQEDRSVVYNCCWPLPVQSFSGPSPMGLVTIFYCLRFETSLFVASYDSQGYGGGIQPCLHMR
jgi:hypothetical protein